MTRTPAILVAAALLFAGACHEANHVTEPPPAGALAYSGYDEAGRLVVRGWIWLDVALIDVAVEPRGPTPLEFSGAWQLRALVDPERIGPQTGTGTLAGTFGEEGVWVDLRPGWADNSVRLLGVLQAGGPAPVTYEGTWRWETITGLRAQGTFFASR